MPVVRSVRLWLVVGGWWLHYAAESHPPPPPPHTHMSPSEYSETNTVVATAVFASALVIDAFTAYDVADGAWPSSLRGTALLLVLSTAGPAVRQESIRRQRLFLLVVVGVVACVGTHAASLTMRCADACYIFGTLVAIAGMHRLFPLDMADGRLSNAAPPWCKRDSETVLCCTLLFYAGVRQVRAAFACGATVADMGHASPRLQLQGHASGLATSALAFSGAAAATVAVIAIDSSEVRADGTAAVAPILVVSALAQLAGAFVATMAMSEQTDALQELFRPDSCTGPVDCSQAQRDRRFALVVGSPALAWMAALGTLLLAFAPPLRSGACDPTKSALSSPPRFDRRTFVLYPLSAAAVCAWSVWFYCTFQGVHARHEILAVVAIVGAFCTPFVDFKFGSATFAVAMLTDQVLTVQSNGVGVTHPTFSAMLLTLSALIVYTTAATILDCSDASSRVHRFAGNVAEVTQVVGTSVAVLLYLLTATVFGTLSGTWLPEDWLLSKDSGRYARTLAQFTVVHFLPALVWLGCIAARCGTAWEGAVGLCGWTVPKRMLRQICWTLSGVTLAVLWLIVRNFGSDDEETRASTLDGPEDEGGAVLDQTLHRLVDDVPFWIGFVVSGTVPWLMIGFT